MRVIFICGCSEVGQDGVGDYTRKLAAKFIEHSHQAQIVAYNDAFVKDNIIENHSVDNFKIKTLRLSSTFSNSQRESVATAFVSDYNPDWISLQYVAYSFQKKGIPYQFVRGVQKITKGRQTHIMFHEIWQGESKESDWKDKVIGFLQKRISLLLIKLLSCNYITTTNEYYKSCIMKLGMSVQTIPVFSNMPEGSVSNCAILNRLPANILNSRANYIIGAFFGGFHDNSLIIDRLRILADEVINRFGRELVITHVGRGGGVEKIFEEISVKTGIKGYVLGEWSSSDIGAFMKDIDLGLTNYPKILFEKSGSIAAFLFNGCPVLFLKDSFEQDNRVFSEVSEMEKLIDLRAFITQDKGFSKRYDVENSYKKYIKLFNNKDI